MFGSANVPGAVEFHFERWATNPLHYGSFSTWPIGANRPADARQRLAANVGRIFFAQDATDQAIGTVSGSVSAGERAAKQIVGCLNRRNCPRQYQPRNVGNTRPPSCPTGQIPGMNGASHLVIYPITLIFASFLSLAITKML